MLRRKGLFLETLFNHGWSWFSCYYSKLHPSRCWVSTVGGKLIFLLPMFTSIRLFSASAFYLLVCAKNISTVKQHSEEPIDSGLYFYGFLFMGDKTFSKTFYIRPDRFAAFAVVQTLHFMYLLYFLVSYFTHTGSNQQIFNQTRHYDHLILANLCFHECFLDDVRYA
jgi:hypothetical protein